MKGDFHKKWKQKLKLWGKLILNWRFLVCFGIGWLITNGWSYVLLGLGTITNTTWMIAVASAYLMFLWLPISPEKVVTVAIALFLVRRLFPKHTKTLQAQIMEAAGNEQKSSDETSAQSAQKATAPTSPKRQNRFFPHSGKKSLKKCKNKKNNTSQNC
ncbi:MAG: hypothetical protein IJW55_05830 [Clostridia bacterium]|nr:hypothetical protein [Clostridia bacterium]